MIELPSRREICQLSGMIKAGDRYENVGRTFAASGFRHLKKSDKIQSCRVYVAPIELPGFMRQWEQVVKGEGEVLRKVVVRDADGVARLCQA